MELMEVQLGRIQKTLENEIDTNAVHQSAARLVFQDVVEARFALAEFDALERVRYAIVRDAK